MSAGYLDTETEGEKDLLMLVARGDELAFAQIVRKYTPKVYTHLLTYIKNVHRAQELTQDVFMSTWQHREKLSGMLNFPGYLYVITRNKAQRAIQQALEELPEPPADMIQTLHNSPVTNLELKELKSILDKGIGLLPMRRREVFELSRIDNFSYEEIAGQLNISKSAVRQHIIAALAFLRQHVKDQTGTIVSSLLWLQILPL